MYRPNDKALYKPTLAHNSKQHSNEKFVFMRRQVSATSHEAKQLINQTSEHHNTTTDTGCTTTRLSVENTETYARHGRHKQVAPTPPPGNI